MYLKTLIKKDFYHQTSFMLAAAIFLVVPYLIAMVTLITIQMGAHPQENWIQFFHAAGVVDIILCVVLIPFFTGNAIAGERADRSAEFLAYLPIKRKTAILSKAIVAFGISTFFIVLCTLVYYVLIYLSDLHPRAMQNVEVGIVVGSCVFMFGVAWLVSTFAQSATYAAAAGMFVPISLGVVLILLNPMEAANRANLWMVYIIISLVMGPLCFIAGVMYYLRRVEP